MNSSPILSSSLAHPVGTGGFLDPEKIVNEFGIKEGMSVADFGSGAGYFTMLIAKIVGDTGSVYALDVLEDTLDSVKSKAKSENLDNIQVIRADLEVPGASGLPNVSQDVVLVANVLFQSKKKAEIFKEARRVLKDSARLIVIDWAKGSGGFGPPDDLRTDDIAMQSLITGQGFNFVNKINAGRFHYGLIFKNNTQIRTGAHE